jgi:hypothetical protein
MAIEVFGFLAVASMVTMYALEHRSHIYVLGFAASCAAASLYAVSIHSWPFASVEAVWAVVALQRWARIRPRAEGEPVANVLNRPSTEQRPLNSERLAMKSEGWRALIEVAFIVFLFYSNLLMGEFERSGVGRNKSLVWAIRNIFTVQNFEIAIVAAVIGYILFEFRRTRF